MVLRRSRLAVVTALLCATATTTGTAAASGLTGSLGSPSAGAVAAPVTGGAVGAAVSVPGRGPSPVPVPVATITGGWQYRVVQPRHASASATSSDGSAPSGGEAPAIEGWWPRGGDETSMTVGPGERVEVRGWWSACSVQDGAGRTLSEDWGFTGAVCEVPVPQTPARPPVAVGLAAVGSW